MKHSCLQSRTALYLFYLGCFLHASQGIDAPDCSMPDCRNGGIHSNLPEGTRCVAGRIICEPQFSDQIRYTIESSRIPNDEACASNSSSPHSFAPGLVGVLGLPPRFPLMRAASCFRCVVEEPPSFPSATACGFFGLFDIPCRSYNPSAWIVNSKGVRNG